MPVEVDHHSEILLAVTVEVGDDGPHRGVGYEAITQCRLHQRGDVRLHLGKQNRGESNDQSCSSKQIAPGGLSPYGGIT